MADPFLLGSLALGGTLVNQGLNRSNMDYQAQVSKELMDYQWKNFSSPKAQVAAMTAAGLNPAAMFDGGKGNFAAPSVNMPTSQPVTFDPAGTLSSLSQYLLAKAQAKKAGVEAEGTELDNAVKRATQDERIKQIGLQNKWTEEQTTKVINEWQKLVGETNILQTESELKKIDLSKHEKLVDGIIDSYLSRSNRDKQESNSIKEQLPIILDKLKAEKDILEVDAQIAQDFKGTMSSLGVVGDAVKILLNVIKMFK